MKPHIDTYKKQERWIKKNAKDPKRALKVLKEREEHIWDAEILNDYEKEEMKIQLEFERQQYKTKAI